MRIAFVAPLIMVVNLIGGSIAVALRLLTGKSGLAYAWIKTCLGIFLWLTGARVRVARNGGESIEPGTILVSNFIGMDTLPAYLVALPGHICLPIRWFNFLTPIIGWAMWSIDQVAVPKGRPRLFQRRIERVLSNGGVYVHFPSSGNGDLNGTSRLLRRWSAYGYKIRELTVSRIPLADTLIHEELQFKLSETISRDPGEPFLDKKRTILNPIDLPQGSEINV